jgi:23S rRNA pseudouridine2605 synthase
VGRLDCESEGLIFLSNDGEFTQRISHPRFGARKVYLVEVDGRVLPGVIPKLQGGIVDAGERLKAERVTLLSANNSRSVLEIDLAEGKNREIRRMFAAFDLRVNLLQRIQIGPIKLGQLPRGKWRTLTESEINSLLPEL